MTLATFCVSTTLVALANVALQDTLLVWPIPCACFRQPSWPLVLAFAVPEYVLYWGVVPGATVILKWGWEQVIAWMRPRKNTPPIRMARPGAF